MTDKERRKRRLATKRKYNHSPKGRAAIARYVASQKHRDATARWAATDHGRQCAIERMRKWRALNPKKAREQTKASLCKWRDENREAFRIHCRKRRKLEREADGHHTITDIKKLFTKQRGICICGVDLGISYHVDHKTPLSRGGSDWPRNLQLLCPPCNYSKRNRTMREWSQSKLKTC